MKGTKIFGIILITTNLLISGCSGSKPAANDSQQTAGNQAPGVTTGDNNRNNRGQFQNPDVYGEVTAINGNDIELKIMEIQTFGGNGQGSGQRNRDRQNGQNNPGDPNNQGAPNNQNNANNPNGQNSQNPPQNRPSPGNRPDMTPKYTGATEKITLADGIQIQEIQRPNRNNNENGAPNSNNQNNNNNPNTNSAVNNGQNDNNANPNNGDGNNRQGGFGRNMQNITVKDIKVGDIVSVFYSDKDKKVISRVTVRPSFK